MFTVDADDRAGDDKVQSRPSRRKLTATDERAIIIAASTQSLRELASAYGVSHETIRSLLRRAGLHPRGERSVEAA